jgi:hypothetical protein
MYDQSNNVMMLLLNHYHYKIMNQMYDRSNNVMMLLSNHYHYNITLFDRNVKMNRCMTLHCSIIMLK